MVYQYRKDNPSVQKEPLLDHPLAGLVAQLTKISKTKPRLRVAHTVWGKEHKTEVDEEFSAYRLRQEVKKENFLKVRAAITKELFDKLEADVRQEWIDKVEQEHSEALEKWEGAWSSEPSKDPTDQQRCIPCSSFLHFQPLTRLLLGASMELCHSFNPSST